VRILSTTLLAICLLHIVATPSHARGFLKRILSLPLVTKCQICCATAGDSNGADEVLTNQVESKESENVEPHDVAVANDEPELDDPPNEGAASPSDLVPDAAAESSASEESSPVPEESTTSESDSDGV